MAKSLLVLNLAYQLSGDYLQSAIVFNANLTKVSSMQFTIGKFNTVVIFLLFLVLLSLSVSAKEIAFQTTDDTLNFPLTVIPPFNR